MRVGVFDFETSTHKWSHMSDPIDNWPKRYTRTGKPEKNTWIYIWGGVVAEWDSDSEFGEVSNEARRFHWGIEGIGECLRTLYAFDVDLAFFHNLGFDGEFLVQWLVKAGYKWVRRDDIGKDGLIGGTFTWLNDGQFYNIIIGYKDRELVIKCSAKLLGAKVSDLGKSLSKATGKPFDKLELDYDRVYKYESRQSVPKDDLKYLERDCVVVFESLVRISKDYPNILKALTAAGLSMQTFKSFESRGKDDDVFKDEWAEMYGGTKWIDGEKYVHNVLTLEEYTDLRVAYNGGYVYVNPKYAGVHLTNIDGISMDENSMYPDKMKNRKMPYGPPLSVAPEGEHCKFIKVRLRSAILKDPSYPAFLKDLKSKSELVGKPKYLAQLEEPTIYVFEGEMWELIKDKYHVDYKVLKTMYFPVRWTFREWLEEMSTLKENAPDDVVGNQHKKVFNSHYGKWGQAYESYSRTIEYDPEWNNPLVRRYGIEGEYAVGWEMNTKDVLPFIPIAACITSWSAIDLLDKIFKNLDITIYGDTDSCYMLDRKRVVGFEIHANEFGKWKPEKRFTEFKVLRAKCYIAKVTHKFNKYKYIETQDVDSCWEELEKPTTSVTIAGLPEDCQAVVDFDNFNFGLVFKEAKLASEVVDGGVLLVPTDYSIDSENDMAHYVVNEITAEMVAEAKERK